MTSTASEAASYEFTTLTCIPGVIEVSRGLPAPGGRVSVCVNACVLGTMGTWGAVAALSWAAMPTALMPPGTGLPGPPRCMARPAVLAGSESSQHAWLSSAVPLGPPQLVARVLLLP